MALAPEILLSRPTKIEAVITLWEPKLQEHRYGYINLHIQDLENTRFFDQRLYTCMLLRLHVLGARVDTDRGDNEERQAFLLRARRDIYDILKCALHDLKLFVERLRIISPLTHTQAAA